jgi:hypothetical protein
MAKRKKTVTPPKDISKAKFITAIDPYHANAPKNCITEVGKLVGRKLHLQR